MSLVQAVPSQHNSFASVLANLNTAPDIVFYASINCTLGLKWTSFKQMSSSYFISCLVWELVLVGNKVSVVSKAHFLLQDLLHSPCIMLVHDGSREDFLFGRGRRQKRMTCFQWVVQILGAYCWRGVLWYWGKKWQFIEVQLSISGDILRCERVNDVGTDCHLLASDLLR